MSEVGPAPAPQWRRSRHSGSTGGQCVEVAAAGDGLVRIRDSKDPGGAQIIVSAHCWRHCLAAMPGAAGGRLVPGPEGGCLVAGPEDGWVLLRHRDQPGGPVLRFTPVEWRVFLLGARDGDFDLTTEGRFRLAAPPASHLREVLACCPRAPSRVGGSGRGSGSRGGHAVAADQGRRDHPPVAEAVAPADLSPGR